MNMNSPAIDAGPLTAADLDRATNAGRIYWLQGSQDCAACTGACDSGPCVCCLEPAEACTELGADTTPGVLSMARHNKTAGRVVLALVAAPAIAAIVAVVASAMQH